MYSHKHIRSEHDTLAISFFWLSLFITGLLALCLLFNPESTKETFFVSIGKGYIVIAIISGILTALSSVKITNDDVWSLKYTIPRFWGILYIMDFVGSFIWFLISPNKDVDSFFQTYGTIAFFLFIVSFIASLIFVFFRRLRYPEGN